MISIVAIGGTVRSDSSTHWALQGAVAAARGSGADVTVFDGDYLLNLPFYGGPGHGAGDGVALVEAVRGADGVILATPGYHGTMSGLVKNAIDYFEELARDHRPYLHGRAVGLIATAYGHQAAMSSLLSLRTIVHALRGWPTPFGAAVRTSSGLFEQDGSCGDPAIAEQLALVGRQVVLGAERLAA